MHKHWHPGITIEEEDRLNALSELIVTPLEDRLRYDPPRITTLAGGAEALRLAIDEDPDISDGTAALLRTVLKFLDAEVRRERS